MRESLHPRCEAVIDLGAIRANLEALKACHAAHAGKGKDFRTLATIKSNAYGHGDIQIAEALEGIADYFAVACTMEGVTLRENGISTPILVLGPVFENDDEEAVMHNLTLTVFDAGRAERLNACAQKLGRTAKVHIAVDTGMSRIGLRPDENGLEILKRIYALPHLQTEGVFTHFATADEKDKSGAEAALRKFLDFREKCAASGIRIPIWHCANTAAIIDGIGAACGFDMIRCGIGLYGLYPSDEVNKGNVELRPALSWRSFLTFVKEIPKGTSVSYGYHFTADRDMKIGTVCCGYADGYPRLLSKRGGEVLVGGRRCRILGNICMDQFMVDLSAVSEAAAGDEVILIGTQSSGDGQFTDCISADEIAEKCETVSYEVVCDISPRTRRRWI